MIKTKAMDKLMKTWKAKAEKNEEQNFMYIRSLKMKSSGKVDRTAKALHNEAFEKIDCLQCGNCCKTTKPIILDSDISRIAKFLKISKQEVKDKYLEQDEDNDLFFNALPCHFLNDDNICQIYDARPKDCQEFPHTNKKDFASRSYMHSENTVICPAVFYIVEKMKRIV